MFEVIGMVITTTIGLIAGGVSLTAMAIKGIAYSISLRRQISDNFEVLKEVRDRLNHEMKPNDGASMRDAIDRLEIETKRVSKELANYKRD